jgi:DNA-binding CsgD family transcriptional regulator
MFFDLKAGRVAWVLANQHGAITGAVPGAHGLFDAYPGLETFLSEWSREWVASSGDDAPFERSMPGDCDLSDLQLEAVPFIPASRTDSRRPESQPSLMLVRVSLPDGQAELMSVFRERFALTGAESRVAIEVAEGRKPSDIAGRLGLSVHTVRSHLKRIFQKTGVHSQAGLVRALLQRENGNSVPIV